jgi:NPCBM/NEW2 domain
VEKDRSNGETAAGDGRAITLNGVVHAKGLGVHARSEVRYALGGACSTFESSVGVDDETPSSSGSVTFEVWADGAKLFDSGQMTGASATKNAKVDLTGKRELTLIATDAGDGPGTDHADWASARITCAR